ncbi:UNVERIFIED_CONTAM: hypothetical protein ABID98_002635 [Brevibacillus sp. OAP136]|uniref:hypothetical protein n=1 Tax=Brevibacillus fluminis TaxID=511487 RepID=UPI0016056E9C|nr:hypothetical protein [Brevibacillus fluminis]
MKLIKGNRYLITYTNGRKIEGIFEEVKYFGGKIFALWLNSGGNPLYVIYGDVKKIERR